MAKNLVLLGLPGAGKGTQADLIIRDYHLAHISTGDIFRANLANKTELGEQARKYMDAGNLVPDEITNAMVADRLSQDDTKDGFILDGYPRNTEQAKFLDEFMKENGRAISAAFFFDVSDEVLIDRMLKRGRQDDTIEVINNRLKVNKEANMPLVDYYQNEGVLHKLNGQDKLENVYAEVQNVLDALD